MRCFASCQSSSNHCVIDKLHRNQCQACRFNKVTSHCWIIHQIISFLLTSVYKWEWWEKVELVSSKDIKSFVLFLCPILAVQNERPRRHPNQSLEQTSLPSCSLSMLKQTKDDLVNHLDDTISSEILLLMIKWMRHLPPFLSLPVDDKVFQKLKLDSLEYLCFKTILLFKNMQMLIMRDTLSY